MEEFEEREFRLLMTGMYACLTVHAESIQLQSGHYRQGVIFTVTTAPHTRLYGLRLRAGPWVVANGGDLALRSQLHSEETLTLEAHPAYREEIFVLRHGDLYLDRQLRFQPAFEKALWVQPMELAHRTDVPQTFPTPNSNSTYLSADGIDLFYPEAWFFMHLVGHSNLAHADAFEGAFHFGQEPSTQGLPFQLEIHHGGLYPRNRYGYIYIVEDRYLPHNAYYTMVVPPRGLQLLPLNIPTLFALWDGHTFYRITFASSSYGVPLPVERLEDASRVQLVCAG